jgi:hypothetical protein
MGKKDWAVSGTLQNFSGRSLLGSHPVADLHHEFRRPPHWALHIRRSRSHRPDLHDGSVISFPPENNHHRLSRSLSEDLGIAAQDVFEVVSINWITVGSNQV